MESNPYMAMLLQAQRKAQASGICTTAIESPLAEYGLDNLDCDLCNNSGTFTYMKNGFLYSRDCECMAKRLGKRRIQKSGLSDMMQRYTFDSYKAEDSCRHTIKVIAKQYLNTDGSWFYLYGLAGSGKTHICTSICAELMEQGKAVFYMVWRDELSKLKSLMIEDKDAYLAEMNRLKKIDVLYIDDFFKGKISEADVNLAFEIINSRYNDSKLKTIISSELSIEKVLNIDEALGSRVYERSKWFYLESPHENWRLR